MRNNVWSAERIARFNPKDAPLDYAREWVLGYEARLGEADRTRHYPNATEADYQWMLKWADNPKADRRWEAVPYLLERIRQHPHPPYSAEVLLQEQRALMAIPVFARLREDFGGRFRAWIDRVGTYLSIGAAAPIAAPVVALTPDHERVLSVLAKTPTKTLTITRVAAIGPIRNRETVGRLLKALATMGLVDLPHGPRKGYALTSSGLARVKSSAG